jgi:poly(hydroxyalkanoate) granule-associated protein
MVKNLHKSNVDSQPQPQPQPQPQDHTVTGAQLTQSVRDSAQKIWLAGLGAFSKAQAEGGKVFETLVKDGIDLQRKTQANAEAKIAEATSTMTHLTSGITAKATGQWDKLENIFEERVVKALSKMGLPTAKEVQALTKRVDELSAQLKKVAAKPAAKSVAAPKVAVKADAKKAVAVKKVAVKAVKTKTVSK